MTSHRYIPKKHLNDRRIEFLESWRVNHRGIFLDGNDVLRDVYIWSGRFVCGETITIVADSKASRSMKNGELYVGVVQEAALIVAQNNGTNPLEVHAEAAAQRAVGIAIAIDLLQQFKGLPE